MIFTTENTEGQFTDAELALLNAAATVLVADGFDRAAAAAHVTNRWTGAGDTVASLTA